MAGYAMSNASSTFMRVINHVLKPFIGKLWDVILILSILFDVGDYVWAILTRDEFGK